MTGKVREVSYCDVATIGTLLLDKVRVSFYLRAYAEGGVNRYSALAECNPYMAL
jgi:hypothetical protein